MNTCGSAPACSKVSRRDPAGEGPLHRWLQLFVMGAAVVAAWGASRWALCLPLLWVAVMIAWLAIPVGERRGLHVHWLLPGGIVLCVGWVVALDRELAARHTLLIVLAVLLFELARLAAPSDRDVHWLAAGIAATSFLAFLQVLGGLAAAAENVAVLPPGLQEAATIRLSGGRAFGSSALPGHFAALVLTTVPLLWSWLGRGALAIRLIPLSLLVFVAVALYLTRSLAAVMVVGLLVGLALLARKRHRGVWVGGVAVAVLAVAVVLSRGDLDSLEPVHLRMVNWKTAVWVLLHNPWVGVGLGGIGQAGLGSPWAGENISPYTHNSFLQLLAEFGVMGLPLLVMGSMALVSLLRRGAASHGALALAVAVVPLHNLVDFSFYAPEVLLPWAILAGALTVRTTSLPKHAVSSWFLVPVLGVGALVAALEWAGESALSRALTLPDESAAITALEAAHWAPWRIRPVYVAAELALSRGAGVEALKTIDETLAARYWTQPRSAGWAEARARLLIAQGRRAEALVWAREASRRRPGRGELQTLETLCR